MGLGNYKRSAEEKKYIILEIIILCRGLEKGAYVKKRRY